MNTIEIREVTLDEKYRKKWNVYQTDFLNLYVNGEKVSDTLYRISGFGVKLKNPYFILLKNVEAFFEDNITTVKKDKPHLTNQCCIIDNNGVEKVLFNHYDFSYLHGGVIYSVNCKYYNIETGELYCHSNTSMKTEQYLFLDNSYDDDKTKRGVLKINKSDGTYELFQ